MRFPRLAVLAMPALLAASLLVTGCTATFPGGPTSSGWVYTNVDSPAQHLAISTDASAATAKRGTAAIRSFLYMFAFGDASLSAAMKDAGITKVHHVDHQVISFLFGLYSSDTTYVYGE